MTPSVCAFFSVNMNQIYLDIVTSFTHCHKLDIKVTFHSSKLTTCIVRFDPTSYKDLFFELCHHQTQKYGKLVIYSI